jgi:hypothetical protein
MNISFSAFQAGGRLRFEPQSPCNRCPHDSRTDSLLSSGTADRKRTGRRIFAIIMPNWQALVLGHFVHVSDLRLFGSKIRRPANPQVTGVRVQVPLGEKPRTWGDAASLAVGRGAPIG